MRHQAGFVSFNFHVSADRTRIVNYGQWRDPGVVRGMRENQAIVALVGETTRRLGPSAPVACRLLRVVKAPHDPDQDATTLTPGNGQLTLLNSYAVRPERADALVEFLSRSAVDTLRHAAGFVSANLHLSPDRTRLVNYAQWTGAAAVEAARESPAVAELLRRQGEFADSFTPLPLTLRRSVAAAAGA